MKQEKLPKGSYEIFRTLENNGALTQIELIAAIEEKKPRAIRYTVRTLLSKELLVSHPNFDDMRSSLIYINESVKDFILQLLETPNINRE